MFWLFHPGVRHPLYPSSGPRRRCRPTGIPRHSRERFNSLPTRVARVEPRRAVFVLQNEGDPLLSDAQRDELWELFQVPVYVLLLDANHRVCAYECEAHQGCTCRGTSAHIEYRRGWKRRLAAVAARSAPALLPCATRRSGRGGVKAEG